MADVIAFTKRQLVIVVMVVVYIFFVAGVSIQLYNQAQSNAEQREFFECQRKRSDVLELRDQLWSRSSGQTLQQIRDDYLQIINQNPAPIC